MEVSLLIIAMLALLILGMPIGFTLIFIGSIGIFVTGGISSLNGLLSSVTYSSVNGFTFTAIPLFILMAHLISRSNIAQDLFDCVNKWIGHLPGGLGVSTVISSAGFGALSGSSIAATSIMSKICIPEMIKSNYKDSFSSGLVATSTGTLAVLIPPSVPLILYGVQTETPIGKLLIAGMLPGILLVILLSIYIIYISMRTNIVSERYSWKERWSSLRTVWPIALLVMFVMILIYFGVTTSTEAAAFGAAGALLTGLALRRLNLNSIIMALTETVKQTAMIFTIIVGGHLFAYFITLSGVGQNILNVINESDLSKWSILSLIIICYLILGLFLDLIGSMILTLPLVFPIITSLGFDPIWFGVVMVLLLEIGLVTPPVGINLFLTSKYSNIPVERVFYGSIPLILLLLFLIMLLIIFPQITLYLPSKM